VRGLQSAHMRRYHRKLPSGHFKAPKDFARAGAPKRFNVFLGHASKTELVSHSVHMAKKPWKAVDQRAVEIKDYEGVGHSWAKSTVGKGGQFLPQK